MTTRKFTVKRGGRVRLGLPEDAAAEASTPAGSGEGAAAASPGVAVGSDEDPNLYARRRRKFDLEIYDLGARGEREDDETVYADAPGLEIAGGDGVDVVAEWNAALLAGDPFGTTEVEDGPDFTNCPLLPFDNQWNFVEVWAGSKRFVAGEHARPSIDNMFARAERGTALAVPEGENENWIGREVGGREAGGFEGLDVSGTKFSIETLSLFFASLAPWEPQFFRVTSEPSYASQIVTLPRGKRYKVFLAPQMRWLDALGGGNFYTRLPVGGEQDHRLVRATLGSIYDTPAVVPDGEYPPELFEFIRGPGTGELPEPDFFAAANRHMARKLSEKLDASPAFASLVPEPEAGLRADRLFASRGEFDGTLAGVVFVGGDDETPYYVWRRRGVPQRPRDDYPQSALVEFPVLSLPTLGYPPAYRYVGEFPYVPWPNGIVENLSGVYQVW